MIRNLVAACMFLTALGLVAAAEPEGDRALLVVSGRVATLERGSAWTDAWIAPEGDADARLHVRIAPTGVLDAAEFRLAAGDRVQVRVFADEAPFAVQQIRSRETGRMLRLRGLHGEPLWASRRMADAADGPAQAGQTGSGRGGSRVRSAR